MAEAVSAWSGELLGTEDSRASIITIFQVSALDQQLSTGPSLVSRRENDVQEHGQEKIRNQNSQRCVHHGLGRRPAHANRPLARGQAFVATDKNNEHAKQKALVKPMTISRVCVQRTMLAT